MPINRKKCIHDDCDRPVHGKRRCGVHYNRLRRTDPAFRAGERDRKLRSRYGITAAQADELFSLLDYCCHLCKEPAEYSYKGLCVDLDRATGVVRGALCDRCLKAVAHFTADESRMLHAIAYLEAADRVSS